jgi:CRISPR/Cas system CSM-associated protein Csm2 small subunit
LFLWKKPTAEYTPYASIFKQMVLSHFISSVKKNLSTQSIDLANPHAIHLKDFINTIENRKKEEKNRQLILKHQIHKADPLLLAREAREWEVVLNKFKEDLEKKINQLRKIIGGEIHETDAFNRFVQLESLSQPPMVLKIRLCLNGWTIERWQNKQEGKGKIVSPETGYFNYSTNSNSIAQKVFEFKNAHNFHLPSPNHTSGPAIPSRKL